MPDAEGLPPVGELVQITRADGSTYVGFRRDDADGAWLILAGRAAWAALREAAIR